MLMCSDLIKQKLHHDGNDNGATKKNVKDKVQ